jgi:hypothetical protein
MSDVTHLLDAAAGDRRAAADILPLVYDTLKRPEAGLMANGSPGHFLTAQGVRPTPRTGSAQR